MLLEEFRKASDAFIEGLIDEGEYVTKLILALGAYKSADDSITDIAFLIQGKQ